MLYASSDPQSYSHDPFDAFTKLSIEATKKIMAISIALADYTKNSIEISLNYVDNTANSKNVEDLLNAQTEVIKSTFDELLALISKFEKLNVDIINSDTTKLISINQKKIVAKKTLKNNVIEKNISTLADTDGAHAFSDESEPLAEEANSN